MTVSAASLPTDGQDKLFAKDEIFWNNYLNGRPSLPPTFFSRLFSYHASHHGLFNLVHDVGAGNGPYAKTLRTQFQHVTISDIAAENIVLAKDRLGTQDGFSFRKARLEDGDDIPAASVDMVIANNVLHFCSDQALAMTVIARQLKPGGTFACAGFGTARFDDARIQDIYTRINEAGGRALLSQLDGLGRERLVGVMARTSGIYNVGPLDPALFLPSAQRIHLNMQHGGITGPLPPEYQLQSADEAAYAGVDDVLMEESEEGWGFEADLKGLREHIETFPFVRADTVRFEALWKEMEELVGQRVVKGVWPAKIVLATKR